MQPGGHTTVFASLRTGTGITLFRQTDYQQRSPRMDLFLSGRPKRVSRIGECDLLRQV
jgi:hypothetical protein